MLDLKRILQNPDELKRMLISRGQDSGEADGLLKKNELRCRLMADSEEKKALRNQTSKKIGMVKQQSASSEELKMMMKEMRVLGSEIATIDADIAELTDKIDAFVHWAPNYLHTSVPVGKNDKDNVEIDRWGTPRAFPWEPKPHWNIGTDLHILDFDNIDKVSGVRLTVYRDLGAQLERAVINFFLDTLIRAGYREVLTPYMVMRDAIAGKGERALQFEEVAYRTDENALLLHATDGLVTTLYRDMILNSDELPIRHCASSACLRTDTNGTDRDTCGLIRQPQFNKVEIAELCKPEDSYKELERMTKQAQAVLQLLNLPYRVMLPCTGDLNFSAAKTYKLEVWMPSHRRYVEICSCSNSEDFHARRLNIRYREIAGGEPQLCHTLSGSGIAVEHTVAAILENYQNEDSSVAVPDVLRSYMHTDCIQ